MAGDFPLAQVGMALVAAFVLLAALGWYLKGRRVLPPATWRPGREVAPSIEAAGPGGWGARAKLARYFSSEGGEDLAFEGVVEEVHFWRGVGEGKPEPISREGFVDRGRELPEVVEALRKRRPVLLWGQEGMGCSALAGKAVDELLGEFPAGILWLRIGRGSLWAISNAIAWALGDEVIPTLAQERRLLALKALLEGQDLLLVLDETERIRSVISLLENCLPSTVALLAIGLAPFSGFGLVRGLGPLSSGDSVELFTRMVPTDPEGRERVERICRLLGGHPLSIGIAAGLVREGRKQLAELLRELEEGAQRKGDLAPPERWVAMVGAVVLKVLSEGERELWLDLGSLPRRGAALELLASLAGEPDEPCREKLLSLAGLGLVEREGEGFRLHPLVAGLAEGEDPGRAEREDRAGRAIRDFVLKHAPLQAEGDGAALEAEIANILGEMDRSYGRAQWERYLELVDALARPASGFLGRRGRWDEILRHARQAHSLARSQEWEQALAQYASFIAVIQHGRAHLAEARNCYREALEIYQRAGSPRNLALTLQKLGGVAEEEGAYAEAQRYLEESWQLWRELGDEAGLALAEWALGNVSYRQEQYDQAEGHYQRAWSAFKGLGDERNQAGTLHQLGMLAQSRGDSARAREYYAESLRLKRSQGERRGLGSTLYNLASLLQAEGELGEAEELYREGLEVAEQAGDREGAGLILHQLGRLAQERGEGEVAGPFYQRSIALARMEEDWATLAEGFERLAALSRAGGRLAEAAGFLEEALKLRRNLEERARAASILHQLGEVSLWEGNRQPAERYFQESLELAREEGDQALMASALGYLGEVSYGRGDYAEAGRQFDESLKLYRELGDSHGQARAWEGLGQVAYGKGYYGEAQRLYAQAQAILRGLGEKRAEARLLIRLAGVSLAQGRYNQAQSYSRAGLQLSREEGDPLGMAQALAELGRVFQRLRQEAEARQVREEALASLEGLEGGGELYRRLREELEAGEKREAAARPEG